MQTFKQTTSLKTKSLSSFEPTIAKEVLTPIKTRRTTLTAQWVVIDGRLTCRWISR